MSGLAGARCVGLWRLFDSPHPADHHEARQLCAECPAITACAELLADVQRTSYPGKSGRPQGTWAGRRVGTKQAACGTDSGYFRHRRNGQDACEPCMAAHREYERERAGAA